VRRYLDGAHELDDDDLDEAAGGQRGAISTTPTSWTMTT
jgi:hypothetical protein